MEELKEKKKKRLEKERKEEERDKKIYEQVVKEFQSNKVKQSPEKNVIKRLTKTTKSNESDIDMNSLNNIQLPQIKISEKKTQAILEESGMLDAYKYLIIQLCKNGFPTGNLFEYSAYVIKNYEKKWKEKKSKMTKEKVEKYWEEKKEEVKNIQKNNNASKEDEIKLKALNRSLEEREINKIIKSLDKSRSSRHKQTFPNFNKNKSEEKLQNNDNKSKLSVQQREQNKGKAKNKAQQKSKSPPSNSNKNDTQKNDKKTNEKSPSPQKKTTAAKKKK